MKIDRTRLGDTHTLGMLVHLHCEEICSALKETYESYLHTLVELQNLAPQTSCGENMLERSGGGLPTEKVTLHRSKQVHH